MVTRDGDLKRDFVAIAKRTSSFRDEVRDFTKEVRRESDDMPPLEDGASRISRITKALKDGIVKGEVTLPRHHVDTIIEDRAEKKWAAREYRPAERIPAYNEAAAEGLNPWIPVSDANPSLAALRKASRPADTIKSLEAARSQEARALQGLRSIARDIAARNPRIPIEKALHEAARDPAGQKFYAVYKAAQDAQRRLETPSDEQ